MSNMQIQYVNKDATQPIGDGHKLIIHCCNDEGKWGRGFVLAISKRWSEPEKRYRIWHKNDKASFKLGNIQAVRVTENIAVINMIGQHGIYAQNNIPPVRYKEVEKCLTKVADLAEKYKASVHCPYLMCCDLAGGKWEIIESLLIESLCSKEIPVIVYDLYSKRVKA